MSDYSEETISAEALDAERREFWKSELIKSNLKPKELIDCAVNALARGDVWEAATLCSSAENANLKRALRLARKSGVEVEEKDIITPQMIAIYQADATEIASDVNNHHAQILSTRGKDAANKKHEPINKKLEEIRKTWANGAYKTRDKCAEVEGMKHTISFSAARRALYNTPEPSRC